MNLLTKQWKANILKWFMEKMLNNLILARRTNHSTKIRTIKIEDGDGEAITIEIKGKVELREEVKERIGKKGSMVV